MCNKHLEVFASQPSPCGQYMYFVITIILNTGETPGKNTDMMIKRNSHYYKLEEAFVSPTITISFLEGVNRPMDRRILKFFLPGFRIQSEILTYLRILKLVSSIFWIRILDFACEEVRIVDLNNRQKCVVSGYTCIFLSRTRLTVIVITHNGQQYAVTCCRL